MIAAIKEAVTIPVMAKARIGHFVEAQVLEALDVDYIDESEVRRLCDAPRTRHAYRQQGLPAVVGTLSGANTIECAALQRVGGMPTCR